MNVKLLEYPDNEAWMGVKLRALITAGKTELKTPPTEEWKWKILKARHSPIRYLRFSFMITDLPYWVACELRTHVHDMPYVSGMLVNIRSQRNDRQDNYDRNAARQDAPVNMILDINGEQIMILANKRLCRKATPEAREVVQEMCRQVSDMCPEFEPFLVPMCAYVGECKEMYPCDAER